MRAEPGKGIGLEVLREEGGNGCPRCLCCLTIIANFFPALRAELPHLKHELLLVDDESAGSEETAKIVASLAAQKYPIRIKRRYKSEGRGLSSAVVLGFREAKFSVLLSMDADLQHEVGDSSFSARAGAGRPRPCSTQSQRKIPVLHRGIFLYFSGTS